MYHKRLFHGDFRDGKLALRPPRTPAIHRTAHIISVICCERGLALQDRRLRRPGGALGTAAGSGVQLAMIRAHSRALALSVMPGNNRRTSIAAENSPPCS